MRKCIVILAAVMLASSASAALTPAFDGLLDEWVGPDVTNLGSQPGPDFGTYTLLSTWDADNLYFGMDRDTTDRYLGDTYMGQRYILRGARHRRHPRQRRND